MAGAGCCWLRPVSHIPKQQRHETGAPLITKQGVGWHAATTFVPSTPTHQPECDSPITKSRCGCSCLSIARQDLTDGMMGRNLSPPTSRAVSPVDGVIQPTTPICNQGWGCGSECVTQTHQHTCTRTHTCCERRRGDAVTLIFGSWLIHTAHRPGCQHCADFATAVYADAHHIWTLACACFPFLEFPLFPHTSFITPTTRLTLYPP